MAVHPVNNPSGTQEISLTVFSGENLELEPTDLPQGLSPACPNVAFLPGQAFTRPPLQVLSTLGTSAEIIYNASFVKRDGTVSQLVFDSLGGIYADGVQIGQTQAGNRFHACNAFGKMYVAISDGLHGADVPLQYTAEGYLDRVSQDGPGAGPSLQNYALGAISLTSLNRSSNQVTATTSSPHDLKAGFQGIIDGVPDSSTNLVSIVVNNEKLPGIATVTMPSAHGLVPGLSVSILGVMPTSVGGSVTSWTLQSDVLTFQMNSAHNLQPGNVVIQSTNGQAEIENPVTAVPTTTELTMVIANGPQANASGSTGTLTVPFPLSSGTVVEITAIPTATTFQFSLTSPDGTWNTGSVTFPWDGTFYVTAVTSPTSFTYVQTGPNASTTAAGTVTPEGQIAPGQRNAVCIFQTRTGYLTKPSSPVTVSANGNQYLSVTNIPIGPANVVARIIAFTGANGGKYFYLPVAPRDPSQSYLIGTSTVIADNTTTSAIFDFADASLFDGISIDSPGNNLFAQEILGPCLGFYSYASRLAAWGERNRIQQYLNMGFEGGIYAGAPNAPLGWTVVGSGTLVAGDYGQGWQITGGGSGTDGMLTQPAYLDQYGVAILTAQTLYTFGLWLKGAGSVKADFYSPTQGVLASAVIASTSIGGWGEATFSSKTPVTIPADTLFRVYASGLATGQTVVLDEMEQIYAANPYRLAARMSYVLNPEAFDGVTGVVGPASDPRPIMGMEERRDALSILTYGPNGSLYETEDTASGEPSSWSFRHVSSKCGLISVWGIAKFEDWFCWASDTGLRIYDGGTVDKISQEQQLRWDSIDSSRKQFVDIGNDPYIRRVYAIYPPLGSSVNGMMVLDYRELNTAGALTSSGTLRVGQTGKVVTTDITRKWSPWNVYANHCGVISLASGAAVMTFCGSLGGLLTTAATSSVYTLNEGSLAGVDADYGPFWNNSYYQPYFFMSADEAAQRQLGLHRLHHGFMTLNITGIGSVYIIPSIDRLENTGRVTRPLAMTQDMARDLEIALDLAGERISYRICCQPAGVQPAAPTAQAGWKISQLTVSVRTHAYSPIRGRNS